MESGHGAKRGGDRAHQQGTLEPQFFNARPFFDFLREGVVEHVLPPAQQQQRQQRHHGDEADHQTAAADNAHFPDSFEIGQSHRQEGAGSGERAGEDALPGVNHGLVQRLSLRLAPP